MADPELRTILCPVDFSLGAEEALRYALFLARTHGAKVRVLHVDDFASFGVPGEAGLVEQRHARLGEQLRELVNRYRGGVDIEARLQSGIPYEAIVEASHDPEVDMIVLGTHGRTGLKRLLVGSVAERVVRTAHVPVVTVRHPEYASVAKSPGAPIR